MEIIPTYIVAMREHYAREYALVSTARLAAIRDDLRDEGPAHRNPCSNAAVANRIQLEAAERELERRGG
jgi:hypothetical protein